MPDINGNYIDTSRQKSTMKSKYGNDDLLPEHKLQIQIEKSPELQAAENPYANEPSIDALLAAAHKTLDTPPPSSYTKWQHQVADDAAGREQHRTEQAGNYVNPVANAVQDVTGFTSMIPGPIGMGSKAAFALAGLAKAADPTSDAGTMERLGDVGIGVVPELIGEGRAAMKASKAAQFPSRVWGGATRGTEIGAEFADKQSSIPAVRHYWDALDLGQEPAQALKTGAGRDKGARTALEALQRAGKGSEGVAEEAARSVPTPPIAARSVPSDPLANFGQAHATPGVDANTVLDAEGRALGNQGDYNPARQMGLPGAQMFMDREAAANGPLVEKLTSTWGNRRTGRSAEEIAAQLGSENPLAWKSDMVDMPNGSTVPGNGNGGTPHPGAGLDNQSLRALRDAAQARYAAQVADVAPVIPDNLTMDTAQEALINGDEASRRSTMFGGAGSKQKGSHVRPQKRSPIGKGKK